jgi:hypothetical protein
MFTASEILRNLRPLAIVCVITFVSSAAADEGMWLFNAPPLKQLKEKYHFDPTQQRVSASTPEAAARSYLQMVL